MMIDKTIYRGLTSIYGDPKEKLQKNRKINAQDKKEKNKLINKQIKQNDDNDKGKELKGMKSEI